ncbi:MinD/ParA family protein [Bacillus piscicola]|uniref:MinD/ParA family protein n=1 Tax=Bacillus piscicola TaxID=1632684 RepID=UPI001F08A277|nr:MinD/ParA family protein [Bacillus piscicola]
MNDQARNLRKWMNEAKRTDSIETKVVAVTSGKGGVGKSNISLNLAMALAKQGKKILVIDLDIGMANIDILMGKEAVFHVADLLNGEQGIWDVMTEGPFGIQVIAGGSGLRDIFHLTRDKQERFSKQMEMLDGYFDYILFDMGAGASAESLQFVLAADEAVVVTTPEPTSITDAYAMLKYMYGKNQELPASLVINRAYSTKEGEQAANNIRHAVERFLHKKVKLLGIIPHDKHVYKSVIQQRPFLAAYPASPAALAVKRCAATFSGERTITSERRTYQRFIGKLKLLLNKGE